MANLIEQFIVSNGFSVTSAKQTAFKDSLEWKNIFDKTMLDFFKQNNNTDRTVDKSVQIQARSEVKEKNEIFADKNQRLFTNNARAQINNANSEQGQVEKTLAEQGTRSLPEKIINNNVITYNIVTSEKELSQAKLFANNTASNSNFNRYSLPLFTQNIARIHLSKTDTGIKIYVRNNQIDERSMMKVLKDVIENINHSDIAIQEIKLNGKTVQI